jgi:hypothetical protein
VGLREAGDVDRDAGQLVPERLVVATDLVDDLLGRADERGAVARVLLDGLKGIRLCSAPGDLRNASNAGS